jgi:putative transposase
LLAERGIDISHETIRFWWDRFGPMLAAEIRKRRVAHMRGYPQWRWRLDEVFVKINGNLYSLWRAVDHEREVLEAVVTAKRDKVSSQEDHDEVRPTADDRHRPASGLPSGNARNWRRGSS